VVWISIKAHGEKRGLKKKLAELALYKKTNLLFSKTSTALPIKKNSCQHLQ